MRLPRKGSKTWWLYWQIEMGGKPPKEARSSAVFALAAMIGAVTMSRVVEDSDASMAILEDVKQRPGAM